VVDLSADLVRRFLTNLESSRSSKIATRNQRLAAIRGFAGFVAERSPVHIEWCGQIRSIPFKKAGTAVMPYLEKAEIDALLAAPDRQTAQGRRVYALLLFLYNVGARATEAAQLKVRDLDIRASCVKIIGKGGNQRLCRLWRSPSAEPAKSEFNSENVPKDEHNEPVNERQHERGKAHAKKAVERRPEKRATDGSFVYGIGAGRGRFNRLVRSRAIL
jgi:site-specific recombinase XerD